MLLGNLLKANTLAQSITKDLASLRSGWDVNEQPVIGIVSQPLDSSFVNDPRFVGYNSYIMAAYVEFFQGSGARVVPLILGEDWSVNLEKVHKLDGVFFPGGEGGYM